MKWFLALICLVGVIATTAYTPEAPQEWAILISGDLHGYLSPCGCTSPMIGGIKRRGTAIRSFRNGKNTLVLENDGLTGGITRQEEIKAETLAEALKAMNVDAINLGVGSSKLGIGHLLTLQRLSGNKILSTSLRESKSNPCSATVVKGPFLVGGIEIQSADMATGLGLQPLDEHEAISEILTQAQDKQLVPILLLQGKQSDARRIANENPELRLIVYRSETDPPSEVETVNGVTLVTAGDRGKKLIRLVYRSDRFEGYQAIPLGPEYVENKSVSKTYSNYLKRVESEDLLGKVGRVKTEEYVGSASCGKCHVKAYQIWLKTDHAIAFQSLEKVGHDKDPECVGCHVDGLNSEYGFRSKKQTPALASVGCESCHGPGKLHSINHGKNPPIAKSSGCVTCHNKNHSPNFKGEVYSPKIQH